jgi:hypothetical protein
MFCPPTLTCKLVKGTGQVVAGHESNGDFHYTSAKADVFERKGTSSIPTGLTIPALIN